MAKFDVHTYANELRENINKLKNELNEVNDKIAKLQLDIRNERVKETREILSAELALLIAREMRLTDAQIMDKQTLRDLVIENQTLLATSQVRPIADLPKGLRKASDIVGGAPSVFSKRWNEVLSKGSCVIFTGRPEWNQSLAHPAIYFKGFGTFADQCNGIAEIKLKHEDYQRATSLCGAMSRSFENDLDRQNAFRAVMQTYWPGEYWGTQSAHVSMTDLSILLEDSKKAPLLMNVEVKTEKGEGGGDCYMQNIANYITYWQKHHQSASNSIYPSLLVELVGPLIIFSAAVTTRYGVLYTPLAQPLSLILQVADPHAIELVARYLAAARACLKALISYYTDGEYSTFPYETNCDNNIQVVYDTFHPRQPNNFYARVNGDVNRKLFVKFCRTYSQEAHQYAHENGFAPKLHGIRSLPGGWKMVVMDHASDDFKELGEYSRCKQAKKPILDALDKLHSARFVHGDLRPPNILYSSLKGQCLFVDFEWAGAVGTARYPNHFNLQCGYPRGARFGGLISPEHDLSWITKWKAQSSLFSRHRAFSCDNNAGIFNDSLTCSGSEREASKRADSDVSLSELSEKGDREGSDASFTCSSSIQTVSDGGGGDMSLANASLATYDNDNYLRIRAKGLDGGRNANARVESEVATHKVRVQDKPRSSSSNRGNRKMSKSVKKQEQQNQQSVTGKRKGAQQHPNGKRQKTRQKK